MTSACIIVSAASARSGASQVLSAPGGSRYWYFGDDFELASKIGETLPHGTQWSSTGARLNAISERCYNALLNMDARFDVRDWDWWESRNIAERGPHTTTVIAECCRFLLFTDLLKSPEPNLFVVEQDDLAMELLGTARALGINAIWRGPSRSAVAISLMGRQICNFLRFCRALLRRAGAVLHLQYRRLKNPAPWSALSGCDVLFAAWTKVGDFPASGPRDQAHYMGLLPQTMRQNDITVGYIALPLDELSDLRSIADHVVAATDVSVLPDDAIGLLDLARAAVRALCPKAKPGKFLNVDGWSVANIVRMVMRREKFDWRAVNALLLARVGPALAAHGCRPKAVFHVYENQSWEKCLRQGLKAALPASRVVGCHQSPMSRLYLSMPPSRSELASGRWPDFVLTHGEHSAGHFLAVDTPKDRILNGGLFREGAFIIPKAPEASGRRNRRVLCATGPGYQDCVELAYKACDAVHDSPNTDLIINFHPLMTPPLRARVQDFIRARGRLSANIHFSDRPIKDILRDHVDAVLYADTNSGFEGLSAGARVVNVMRDHALAFDKLPDGLARRVYGGRDLREALRDLDDDGKWPTEAAVSEALRYCFSDFSYQTILAAAGLDNATESQSRRNPNKEVLS